MPVLLPWPWMNEVKPNLEGRGGRWVGGWVVHLNQGDRDGYGYEYAGSLVS
jgi:hypothetical protein